MNKFIGLMIFTLFFLTRSAYSQTTHIEAENWSAMSGVQTESTSDAGGGLDVGWIDPGDWMEYSYTAPSAGTYNLRFRLATTNSFAQFQVKLGATVLTTVDVPVTGGFQTWQTVTATVALSAGTQTLRLNNSGTGAWNINWWELDAPAGGTNQPPVVGAGPDQVITLPTSSVQLSGSATDPDGSITSQSWSKVSGPASFSFSSTSVLNPTVSNLVQGTYTFRLSATDNSGATSSDDIVVNVNGATSTWSLGGNTPGTTDFIGTTNTADLVFKTNNTTQAKITSTGEFWARKIKVTQSGWADYVFNKNYRLRPLYEVERYIDKYHHLPDVPSAANVQNYGIDLGNNQSLLLQKIEELTLYVVDLNKKVSKLSADNASLKKQIAGMKAKQ